jgi:hypothetical protein
MKWFFKLEIEERRDTYKLLKPGNWVETPYELKNEAG